VLHNKCKIDRIEDLILTKDNKFEIIREDIDNLRKIVMSTDGRTAKLMAPAIAKISEQVRQGNIRSRGGTADVIRSVYRVENSLQAEANHTVGMKAELMAMATESKEIKNALVSTSRDMKVGIASLMNEAAGIKNALQSVSKEMKHINNVPQVTEEATQEMLTSELERLKK